MSYAVRSGDPSSVDGMQESKEIPVHAARMRSSAAVQQSVAIVLCAV